MATKPKQNKADSPDTRSGEEETTTEPTNGEEQREERHGARILHDRPLTPEERKEREARRAEEQEERERELAEEAEDWKPIHHDRPLTPEESLEREEQRIEEGTVLAEEARTANSSPALQQSWAERRAARKPMTETNG